MVSFARASRNLQPSWSNVLFCNSVSSPRHLSFCFLTLVGDKAQEDTPLL